MQPHEECSCFLNSLSVSCQAAGTKNKASSGQSILSGAHLLAHGLRVGDGGAEESVPLQSAIEPSPVVVTVARVGQAPGDQGVELSVGWIAWLS